METTNYKADVLQNIQLSTADPSGVASTAGASNIASAAIAAGNARKLNDTGAVVAGVVKEGMALYAEGEQQVVQQEGQQLRERFLEAGKAADKANATRSSIMQDIERLKGGLNASETNGVVGDNAQVAVITERMQELQKEADRLKDAADGGMSNADYVARVQSLTKRYLARFPGYSDKIRDIVGAATGLQGADQWAARAYVEDRFAKNEKKDGTNSERDLEIKFWSTADTHLNTATDINSMLALRDTNPVEYANVKARTQNIIATKAAVAIKKAELDATDIATKEGAEKLTIGLIDKARTSVVRLFSENLTEQTGKAATEFVKGVISAGGYEVFSTSEAGKAALEVKRQEIKGMIASARSSERRDYIRLAAEKRIPDSMQKTHLSYIDEEFADIERQWGDNGSIAAMMTVMSNYRGATVKEQMDILNSMRDWDKRMGLANFSTKFYGSEAERADLKKQWPEVYALFERNSAIISSAEAKLASMRQPDTKANVEVAVKHAVSTGGVVDPLITKDVESRRQATAVITAKADEYLRSPAFIEKMGDPQVAGYVNSALVNGMAAGSLPGYFRSANGKKAMENFATLPDDIKGGILAKASDSSVVGFQAVEKVKAELEEKHGIKLIMGVTPAGDLRVVPAKVEEIVGGKKSILPPNAMQQGMSGGGVKQVADPKYVAAAKEFEEKMLPRLSNLTHIRSGLTGQQPAKVSEEYARLFNEGKPFNGFYSLYAVAPAERTPARRIDNALDAATSSTSEGTGASTEQPKKATSWWEQ